MGDALALIDLLARATAAIAERRHHRRQYHVGSFNAEQHAEGGTPMQQRSRFPIERLLHACNILRTLLRGTWPALPPGVGVVERLISVERLVPDLVLGGATVAAALRAHRCDLGAADDVQVDPDLRLDWFSDEAQTLLDGEDIHEYPGLEAVKASLQSADWWLGRERPRFSDSPTAIEDRVLSRLNGMRRSHMNSEERRVHDTSAIRLLRQVLHYRPLSRPARLALQTAQQFGDEWLYWEHLYFTEMAADSRANRD